MIGGIECSSQDVQSRFGDNKKPPNENRQIKWDNIEPKVNDEIVEH